MCVGMGRKLVIVDFVIVAERIGVKTWQSAEGFARPFFLWEQILECRK